MSHDFSDPFFLLFVWPQIFFSVYLEQAFPSLIVTRFLEPILISGWHFTLSIGTHQSYFDGLTSCTA